MTYREAVESDISELAIIRSLEWENESYWVNRISGYFSRERSERVIYVAMHDGIVIAFIAGHLTTRHNCDGELQWVNVVSDYKRQGIATELLRLLARWFIDRKATTICVDPGTDVSREFFAKSKAERLNGHWMFWPDIHILLESRTAH